MKRFLVILGPVLVLGILACTRENKAEEAEAGPITDEPAVQVAEVERVLYSTCPMESHKHIHANEEGTCPECGMTLVAVVQTEETHAEFYGCPMPEHRHVRHGEPGTCEECGMKLVPMKLEVT